MFKQLCSAIESRCLENDFHTKIITIILSAGTTRDLSIFNQHLVLDTSPLFDFYNKLISHD